MTTKTEILQIVRKHCLNCVGGSYTEVEKCTAGPDANQYSTCALWAFRLGKDPDEPSEAKKAQGVRLAAHSPRKKVNLVA